MTPISPPAPVLEAQQTFRTLLNAMARPGTIHTLTVNSGETPEQAICFALMDFEVAYAVAAPGDGVDELTRWIAIHTACQPAPIADAAFVIAYGALPTDAWAAIRRGTLAFPDTGATIIYCLPAIGETEAVGRATRVTLTGPGIETAQTLTVTGLPASEFAALTHANREYPMGVDVILVDPAGHVACIPRSSKLVATTETEGA
jgi:alpha-D-ribose 1-methylphosphonate 5-triphosphate synthase subunit PhnH